MGAYAPEQAVPARPAGDVDEHQCGADQAHQRGRGTRCTGDAPGLRQCERAVESAEPVQQAALRVGQQAMAGVERVVQQPVVDRRQDVDRGERRAPRRGALDGERQGVQPPADPRRERRIRCRAARRPDTVGQQPRRVRIGQRRYGQHALSRHVQWPSGGDQHPQRRAAGEQAGHHRHHGGEQVLGVVDDHERGPLAEGVGFTKHMGLVQKAARQS
ncbi:hypothetical protein [Micromonospora sp. NPDC047074]|uniref:hypothetical protein n=1 Tax=Micromonospora sp. NPDC047074 TaxID=3154339 RepID=UPI0033EA9512